PVGEVAALVVAGSLGTLQHLPEALASMHGIARAKGDLGEPEIEIEVSGLAAAAVGPQVLWLAAQPIGDELEQPRRGSALAALDEGDVAAGELKALRQRCLADAALLPQAADATAYRVRPRHAALLLSLARS